MHSFLRILFEASKRPPSPVHHQLDCQGGKISADVEDVTEVVRDLEEKSTVDMKPILLSRYRRKTPRAMKTYVCAGVPGQSHAASITLDIWHRGRKGVNLMHEIFRCQHCDAGEEDQRNDTGQSCAS